MEGNIIASTKDDIITFGRVRRHCVGRMFETKTIEAFLHLGTLNVRGLTNDHKKEELGEEEETILIHNTIFEYIDYITYSIYDFNFLPFMIVGTYF